MKDKIVKEKNGPSITIEGKIFLSNMWGLGVGDFNVLLVAETPITFNEYDGLHQQSDIILKTDKTGKKLLVVVLSSTGKNEIVFFYRATHIDVADYNNRGKYVIYKTDGGRRHKTVLKIPIESIKLKN